MDGQQGTDESEERLPDQALRLEECVSALAGEEDHLAGFGILVGCGKAEPCPNSGDHEQTEAPRHLRRTGEPSTSRKERSVEALEPGDVISPQAVAHQVLPEIGSYCGQEAVHACDERNTRILHQGQR